MKISYEDQIGIPAHISTEVIKLSAQRVQFANVSSFMLPTPSTSQVNFDRVYEPAEDSFLLLDTLASPAESLWLQKRFLTSLPAPLVAEIGTGSGVVIAFLMAHAKTILGREDVLGFGVDVNQYACEVTSETILQAQKDQHAKTVFLDCISADLTTNLRPGSIDVLIFNPPYVPTIEMPSFDESSFEGLSDFDKDSKLLALSFAGGKNGMETTSRLLATLSQILSPAGVAYVLLCAQNKPEVVVQDFLESTSCIWQVATVAYSGKQAGWEKLQILKFFRP